MNYFCSGIREVCSKWNKRGFFLGGSYFSKATAGCLLPCDFSAAGTMTLPTWAGLSPRSWRLCVPTTMSLVIRLLCMSGPFVMGACCPHGNTLRLLQTHTRACKLKFNPALRHGGVIFKSKQHLLHNKIQPVPFTLILQLILHSQNGKAAWARRSNSCNFQSDECYAKGA